MRIAYQYRLQPNYEQRFQMSRWLDVLRCQYNRMLSDRFDWWEMNRYRTFTFPQASHGWLEGNWVISNEILPYKAVKAGRLVVKVNPAGTSQHCANCLNRVPKELSDRWHECPHCGVSRPRDVNSGILIKKVGLGHRLTIKRESRNGRRSPRCTAKRSA